MRRIAIVAKYVRAVAQGDVSMEEETLEEEEDTKEDTESEEDDSD